MAELELVRLSGRVSARDGEDAFRRAVLVVDGKELATVDDGEIDVDADGSTVTIEVPAEGLVVLGAEPMTLRGAWRELRDTPEARGFTRNVVAPYAEVELRVTRAEPRTRAEVWGEAFEFDFAQPATLRDAPTRRPSRVLARVIGFGDDEETTRALTQAIADWRSEAEAPSPQAPEAKAAQRQVAPARWIPTGALTALGLVCAAVGVLHPRHGGFPAAVLFAGLAAFGRPTPETPSFRAGADELTSPRAHTIVFVTRMLLAAGALWVLLALFGLAGGRSSEPSPTTVGAATAAILFVWTLTVLLAERRDHAALAALVSASGAPSPGARGGCAGVVRADRPVTVAGERAALGVVIEMDKGLGRKADERKGAKLVVRGPFAIDVGDVTVRVDPAECVWATTLERRPLEPQFDYTIEHWIPVGGAVAASGMFSSEPAAQETRRARRARRGAPPAPSKALALTSAGAEPAVLFATAPGEDPRALARSVVRARHLTLAALLVALVADVVVQRL